MIGLRDRLADTQAERDRLSALLDRALEPRPSSSEGFWIVFLADSSSLIARKSREKWPEIVSPMVSPISLTTFITEEIARSTAVRLASISRATSIKVPLSRINFGIPISKIFFGLYNLGMDALQLINSQIKLSAQMRDHRERGSRHDDLT